MWGETEKSFFPVTSTSISQRTGTFVEMGNYLFQEEKTLHFDSKEGTEDVGEVIEDESADSSGFEEKYLNPLASTDYHYEPILALVFSFLPASYVLNTLSLVNHHFLEVVLDRFIFPFIQLHEKQFHKVTKKEICSGLLYERLRTSVLEKGYRTKSLSLSGAFLLSYMAHLSTQSEDSEEKELDGEENGSNDQQDAESKKIGRIIEQRMYSFKPFSSLFSKLKKLEISHFAPLRFLRYKDVVDLLNNIPSLEHLIIHNFYVESSDGDLKFLDDLEEHQSLRILQLLDRPQSFRHHLREDIYDVLEKSYVHIMEKCPFLVIFQVPVYLDHICSQSVFYDPKSQDLVGTGHAPLPVEKSPLKKYLRDRFLDSSFLRKFIMPKSDQLFKGYFPIYFYPNFRIYDIPGSQALGASGSSSHFLLYGVPARMNISISNKNVFCDIVSPYCDYSIITKFSKKERIINPRPISEMGDVEVFQYKNYGGLFHVRSHLFSKDFPTLKRKEDGTREESFSMDKVFVGDQIPISFKIHRLLNSHEYEEMKNSGMKRRKDIKNRLEESSSKEEEVKDTLLLKQKFVGQKSTAKFDMQVDRQSQVLGSSVHYFSVFGLLDFRVEYLFTFRGFPSSRAFYIYQMFKGDFYVPICYNIKLWMEYENLNRITSLDDQQSNKLVKYYEFDTSKQNFSKEGNGWGFIFLLSSHGKNDVQEEEWVYDQMVESKLTFEVTIEIMGKVLSLEEWIQIQQNFLKMHQSSVLASPRQNFEVSEEKELVIFDPRFGRSHQTGIIKGHCPCDDPRCRRLQLCGIDFSVEFVNFATVQGGKYCALYLKNTRFSYTKLMISGEFRVKVFDKSGRVIGTVKKPMLPGHSETEIPNICAVDKLRREWKFLVQLKLFSVVWDEKL